MLHDPHIRIVPINIGCCYFENRRDQIDWLKLVVIYSVENIQPKQSKDGTISSLCTVEPPQFTNWETEHPIFWLALNDIYSC